MNICLEIWSNISTGIKYTHTLYWCVCRCANIITIIIIPHCFSSLHVHVLLLIPSLGFAAHLPLYCKLYHTLRRLVIKNIFIWQWYIQSRGNTLVKRAVRCLWMRTCLISVWSWYICHEHINKCWGEFVCFSFTFQLKIMACAEIMELYHLIMKILCIVW